MIRKITGTIKYIRRELTLKDWFFVFLIAAALFLIVGLLPNITIILSSDSLYSLIIILSSLTKGIFFSSYVKSWVALIILSLLTGINVMLIRHRALRLRRAGVTATGTLFGVLLSGCSACATGLLPLIGLAGALSVLPFNGFELVITGIILLLVTLYWNCTSEKCSL